MNIKAKLTVRLMADETIIAESDEPVLWQRTLAAMQSTASGALDDPTREIEVPAASPTATTSNVEEATQKLARDVDISLERLVGGISPTVTAPFVALDPHCWDAMKKQTAERGPSAYSSTALVGTILALWFKAAGLGAPNTTQIASVLDELGVLDRNASRGLQRSFWLQLRQGGQVFVNPAHYRIATKILAAFCTKQWEEDPRKD